MEPASGNTVLIIEDERDVVDLLALNLRKAGFATSTAPMALPDWRKRAAKGQRSLFLISCCRGCLDWKFAKF